MYRLAPPSWPLACAHIYWLGLSCQHPLIDTHLGRSLKASARAPASAVKVHGRKALWLSLQLPFLCALWHPHFSMSPSHLISVSVLCQHHIVWLPLCLGDPDLSPDLHPLCGLHLWFFSLPPSSPPTKTLPPPLAGGLTVHPQGHGTQRTVTHLLLLLYCSPGDRPSFLPYSLGVWDGFLYLLHLGGLLTPSHSFPPNRESPAVALSRKSGEEAQDLGRRGPPYA